MSTVMIPADDIPAGPIPRYRPTSYHHAGMNRIVAARIGDRVRFRPDQIHAWTPRRIKAQQKLLSLRGTVVNVTDRIYVRWNHRRCVDCIGPAFLETFENEVLESIDLMATA